MHINLLRLSFGTTLLVLLAACGGGGGSSSSSADSNSNSSSSSSSSSSGASVDDTPAGNSVEAQGMIVFESPQLTSGEGSRLSRFSCSDCHAITEDENGFANTNGFRLPGHALSDALRRTSYKNGVLTDFVDAANSCLDEWMGTDIVWTNDSEDYQKLRAFLEASDTGSGDAEPLNFVISDAALPDGEGDPSRGQLVFNETCANCHGLDAVLGSNPRGIDIRAYTAETAPVIARKVRRSGAINSQTYPEDLVGGTMPFWSEDRLSDQELLDIIAFIGETEFVAVDPDPVDPNPDNNPSNCSSNNPKVGQTASLSTIAHQVSGTARIVDDCTIEIENFNYDGRGVNVEFYAGSSVSFFRENQGGFSITPGQNFLRSNPYVNEKITITLPNGVSLDDFNAISVWCIPFAADFGSGEFM